MSHLRLSGLSAVGALSWRLCAAEGPGSLRRLPEKVPLNTNLKNERGFCQKQGDSCKEIWVQIPCLLRKEGARPLPLRKRDLGRHAEACRSHNMEQEGRAPAFLRGSAHANSRGHTFLVLPLLSFSSLSPCLGSNSSPDGACTWTLAWANFPVQSHGPWREPSWPPPSVTANQQPRLPFSTAPASLQLFPTQPRPARMAISACPSGPPRLAAAPPCP